MSTADQRRRAGHVLSVRRPPVVTPPVVLAGALALLAVAAGLVAARVTMWALDETVLEQSAVHYTSNFPSSLIHDADARATNRLYSLLLSIAFRLGNAPAAIRFDHVLGVLLFLSAAMPIYLFARRLLSSAWAAVAVALLSVALPWMTLTTALFTENLSYPLFWWAMLAACQALWRPGVRNDLLVLVTITLLVATRVQFAGVLMGYASAIVAVAVLRARSVRGQGWVHHVRDTVRSHLPSVVVLGVAVLTLMVVTLSGAWGSEAQSVLGNYSNVVVRHGAPPNMTEALLVELMALALGVGLLPAIVSIAWYVRRVVTPRLDQSYVYLAGAGIILLVFLLITVFSQNGYQGSITEERYFFYVVPAFWLGTFAALADARLRPGDLIVCALALAAIYGAIPFLQTLTEETSFLAPSESVAQHVLAGVVGTPGTGPTVQDTLAICVLLAGALTAFLWTRRPRTRAGWIVGLAVLLQLAITGYAYAVITGNVSGIGGRTGSYQSALGWVDSHSATGRVAWVANVPTNVPLSISSQDQERTTLFWNKSITTWLAVAQTGAAAPIFPMSSLPGTGMEIAIRSGRVIAPAGVAGGEEVVGNTDSPFVQFAGSTVAQGPGDVLTLTRLRAPVQATWLSTGLAPDTAISAGPPVHIHAFSTAPDTSTLLHITFTFLPAGAVAPPVAPGQTSLRLDFGGVRRTVSLPVADTARRTVTLTACAPAGRPAVAGTITAIRTALVSGRTLGGILPHVTVVSSPAPGGCPT